MRMPPAPCTSGSTITAAISLRVLLQMLVERFGIERHDVGLKQQRLEAAEEHRIAADRHGAERVAVVAVLEADEARALRLAAMAPVLVRHLERDLDGGAAVVGVEDAAAGPRRSVVEQQLRQLDGPRVRDAGEQDVVDLPARFARAPASAADGDGRAGSSTTTRCRR